MAFSLLELGRELFVLGEDASIVFSAVGFCRSLLLSLLTRVGPSLCGAILSTLSHPPPESSQQPSEVGPIISLLEWLSHRLRSQSYEVTEPGFVPGWVDTRAS